MSNVLDSGIPWVGEIPSEWKVRPLFSITSENKKKNKEKNENVLSLSYGRIIKRDLSKNFGLLPENFDGYQVVDEGYIIIRSTDLQNDRKSLRVGLVNQYGVITSAYIGLSPSEDIDPQYFFYYLNMCDLKKVFYSLGGGLRQSLRYEEFRRFPVILPTIEEQKLISRYLDKKTTQIDLLVKKIQRKIELLKEQRTLLINKIVTKGLDPDIEMKDSNVEWIGEIPKHWDSLPIRYVTRDHRQGFYTSDPYDDEGIPILRITDINEDHSFSYRDSPKYSRSEEEIEKFYVQNGDFLFPRTGGVGRFGIVDFDFPCIYGSFMIRFRWDNSVNRNFMKFFLESSLFTDQVKQEIHGGVNQNVHVENIKDVLFFRPPLVEQSVISEYLQKESSVLVKQIELEKKRILFLTEYRQSLISSFVTGMVRVTEDMI